MQFSFHSNLIFLNSLAAETKVGRQRGRSNSSTARERASWGSTFLRNLRFSVIMHPFIWLACKSRYSAILLVELKLHII